MAKMRHILQLVAELQVEAEPGHTLPTLLGSYQRAAELGAWDIPQLFAELQVEAGPGPTLPTLLGRYSRAKELVDGDDVGHSAAICRATSQLEDGEDVGHSTAICRATSRGRARSYSSHTAG